MTVLGYAGSQGVSTPPASTVPTSPRSVIAASSSSNTLDATWQPPTSDGGSALTDYIFEYKPIGDSTWSQLILPSTTTSHHLTNVPAGTYEIRLSASNAIGTSLPSTVATISVAGEAIAPPPTTPTPDTPTITIAPSTPYLVPPSNPQSHHPDQTSATSTSELTSTTDAQAPQQTLQPQVDTNHPGSVTVTWQPPAGKSPTGYVVEFRDSSVPSSDTKTPWQQAAIVGPDDHSHTFTLPAGQYVVRVAAILPGEPTGRIILGVARITISPPTVQGDGQLQATSPVSSPNSHRTIIAVCVGLVTAAFMFLILLFWKRRRKKSQLNDWQLPPRRR